LRSWYISRAKAVFPPVSCWDAAASTSGEVTRRRVEWVSVGDEEGGVQAGRRRVRIRRRKRGFMGGLRGRI
jgi:hypothetical protein